MLSTKLSSILSSDEEKESSEEDFIPYENRAPVSKQRLDRAFESVLSAEESPTLEFVRDNKWPIIIATSIAATISIIIFLISFYFFQTHKVTVTVTGFNWQRSIEVEKYSILNDSGWSHPSDAYDVSRYWRYHYSRQVFSHYENYSCGTTSQPRTCQRSVYRNEAVYDWYYEYKINRWITSRWLTTSGTDQKLFWATIPSTLRDIAIIGQERVGGTRKEKYTVLTDTKYQPNVSEEVFLSLKIGQTGTLNVTRLDKIRSSTWS